MTIKPENIARARDLLNAIGDLAHALELMAETIEGDDRRAAAISQVGSIIREKAEGADDLLSEASDAKDALVAAIAREASQCAD